MPSLGMGRQFSQPNATAPPRSVKLPHFTNMRAASVVRNIPSRPGFLAYRSNDPVDRGAPTLPQPVQRSNFQPTSRMLQQWVLPGKTEWWFGQMQRFLGTWFHASSPAQVAPYNSRQSSAPRASWVVKAPALNTEPLTLQLRASKR